MADYSGIDEELLKSPDVNQAKIELQKVRGDILEIKLSREDDLIRLKTEKERVLDQVKDSRRQMNAVFDKLEEAVIEGEYTRYESSIVNIQADLQECDAAIRRIEKSIADLEHIDNQDEAQTFANIKKGAERMEAWRNTVGQIKEKLGKEKIVFEVNADIQDYFDRLKTLGELVDGYMKGGETDADDGKKVSEEDVDVLEIASKARTVVREEKTSSMRMQFDRNPVCVIASCCLPDGCVLLSDNSNSLLKRLDQTHQITDTCSITDIRGVCYIEPSHEVAVCVRGAIKIICLGMEMKVVRSIETRRIDCYGVDYCNGLLYVSEDREDRLHVYEYDTGRHLLTVDKNSDGENIFRKTSHVATNTDGSKIWVADMNNGLIQLDKDGNVVRVVKTDEMGELQGVCVDNEDNVYVCGDRPNNVLQLTSNGVKVRTLCLEDELPGRPKSISYDNKHSRLLVTMWFTDTIRVIYFK